MGAPERVTCYRNLPETGVPYSSGSLPFSRAGQARFGQTGGYSGCHEAGTGKVILAFGRTDGFPDKRPVREAVIGLLFLFGLDCLFFPKQGPNTARPEPPQQARTLAPDGLRYLLSGVVGPAEKEAGCFRKRWHAGQSAFRRKGRGFHSGLRKGKGFRRVREALFAGVNA